MAKAKDKGARPGAVSIRPPKKTYKKEIVFKTTLTADELFKKAITTPIKNSKVKKK